MKATFNGLEDPVERVRAKNLSAFLYFGEIVDSSISEGFAKNFLEKLVRELQHTQNRAV
jgi:hypothetical protein